MNETDLLTLADIHKYYRKSDMLIVPSDFADEMKQVPGWDKLFCFMVSVCGDEDTIWVRVNDSYSISHIIKKTRPAWDGEGHWWEYLPPPPARQWRCDQVKVKT